MTRRGEFWYCNVCGAQNHKIDGECQYCDCPGAACERDNCSEPQHFAMCGCTAKGVAAGEHDDPQCDRLPTELSYEQEHELAHKSGTWVDGRICQGIGCPFGNVT